MKRTACLIALFLLAGCGQEKAKEPAIVDEALMEYIVRFESDIGVSAEGISVVFGELEEDMVGVCQSWSNGTKKVTIDKEYWDMETETQREELMFHELGHCAMNLGHDEGVMRAGRITCPNSIMYPYTFEYCYAAHRDYYVSELKNKTGPLILAAHSASSSGCPGHKRK